MDIFSATSKQVEAATSPKVENSAPTRQVEQTADTNKVNEQAKKEETDPKALSETVNELNKQMDILNTNITFGYNDKIITPPINNLNYVIILDGKNRRKKIITKRVV